MTLVLETSRLILRHITTDDAAFVLELINEPAFHQYIGDRGVRTAEAARTHITERMTSSYKQHGYGLYRVELKTDGAPVGVCGFVKREILADADVGYAFLERYWGRGYAY